MYLNASWKCLPTTLKKQLMYKINEYTADVNRYKFPSVSKSSEQP